MSPVGLVIGKYARPSASSALMSDQRFALPEYAHESFSHVSLPTSPNAGMGRNVQRGFPDRASNACTFPGGCTLLCGASVMFPPVMTTSPQTCGPLVDEYVVARGPRPGFKWTRP